MALKTSAKNIFKKIMCFVLLVIVFSFHPTSMVLVLKFVFKMVILVQWNSIIQVNMNIIAKMYKVMCKQNILKKMPVVAPKCTLCLIKEDDDRRGVSMILSYFVAKGSTLQFISIQFIWLECIVLPNTALYRQQGV